METGKDKIAGFVCLGAGGFGVAGTDDLHGGSGKSSAAAGIPDRSFDAEIWGGPLCPGPGIGLQRGLRDRDTGECEQAEGCYPFFQLHVNYINSTYKVNAANGGLRNGRIAKFGHLSLRRHYPDQVLRVLSQPFRFFADQHPEESEKIAGGGMAPTG
jgi:hypothetical protein